MGTVELKVGAHTVLISEQDAALVAGYTLVVRSNPENGGRRYYVQCYPRGGRVGTRFALHRVIKGLAPGRAGGYVDHKNGDGLDNRRENLRVCTGSQNQQNKRKAIFRGAKPSSIYKGVSRDRERGRWRAHLKAADGKTYRGPRRKSELQAALDYDLLAEKHFGEFARLNFPDVVLGPDEDAW